MHQSSGGSATLGVGQGLLEIVDHPSSEFYDIWWTFNNTSSSMPRSLISGSRYWIFDSTDYVNLMNGNAIMFVLHEGDPSVSSALL